MKKKIKFSIQEKQILKIGLVFFFLQIFLISFCGYNFINSLSVDSSEFKQVDIIVEDTTYFRFLKSHWLVVYSDSSEFFFSSGYTKNKEYSVSRINKSISTGDRLSLMYCEDMTFFGKKNIVVDAKSSSDVYRLSEEYVNRVEDSPVFVIVWFFLLEIICFVLVVFLSLLYKKEIKKIWVKIKKK